jgi:hypothetical protein
MPRGVTRPLGGPCAVPGSGLTTRTTNGHPGPARLQDRLQEPGRRRRNAVDWRGLYARPNAPRLSNLSDERRAASPSCEMPPAKVRNLSRRRRIPQNYRCCDEDRTCTGVPCPPGGGCTGLAGSAPHPAVFNRIRRSPRGGARPDVGGVHRRGLPHTPLAHREGLFAPVHRVGASRRASGEAAVPRPSSIKCGWRAIECFSSPPRCLESAS